MLFSHLVVSDFMPMDCSMPGLPFPHHLPECAQLHVHCLSDAVQPSHPLTPSSALNLSQHQGLFQWVICPHQMTKLLELQHQSFQWIYRVDLPQDWFDLLASKGFSGVLYSTAVWGHQLFGVLPSLHSSSQQLYMTTGKTIALTTQTLVSRVLSLLFNTPSRFVII